VSVPVGTLPLASTAESEIGLPTEVPADGVVLGIAGVALGITIDAPVRFSSREKNAVAPSFRPEDAVQLEAVFPVQDSAKFTTPVVLAALIPE